MNAHYRDFQALYDVDMTLNAGEVLAIIGANGAGKTTLMRSISGLMGNGAGQIRYRGQDIGSLRADQVAALGIALVPEGRQLFPLAFGRGEPDDRRADRPQRSVELCKRCSSCSRSWKNAAPCPPPRFRAASSRWWRLAAR